MRLVLISDTHNRHLEMAPPPDGDVLIHGGDLTGRGTLKQVKSFFEWFQALPHYRAPRYIRSTSSSYIASAAAGSAERIAAEAQCCR